MSVSRQRRLRLGGVEMTLTVDGGYVRRSLPYRYLSRLLRRDKPATVAVNGSNSRVEEARPRPAVTAGGSPDSALAERIAAITWYHTIDLPEGVTTPGRADHREQISLYGLPDDMTGMRALDVATFDGFWAFEMEQRGAEVVAIDIPSWDQADMPERWRENLPPGKDRRTGAGFRLARDLLGSRVERVETSVYDLTPGLAGTFDLVFMSDLLLHLRDPQRALERLQPLVKPGGFAIIAEPYSPELDNLGGAVSQFVGYVQFVWSIPSSSMLARMLEIAGFNRVEEIARFKLNYDHPFPVQKVVFRAHPE